MYNVTIRTAEGAARQKWGSVGGRVFTNIFTYIQTFLSENLKGRDYLDY